MLKAGKFEFHCRWRQDSWLPPFPGSMLRGALGHAMKSIVCALRHKSCEEYLLMRQCLYARIFENKLNANTRLNLSSLPHPYIIEWDPVIARAYQKNEAFTFSLILFGEFIEKLPYFVYAVDRMGEGGLGKNRDDGNGNKMSLESVSHDGQTIYHLDHPELPGDLPFQYLTFDDDKEKQPVDSLELRLITPLRVKHQGRYASSLDFPLFMQTVTRRLKGLWSCYGQDSFELDLNMIMKQARSIQTVVSDLKWHDQKRYSNRQSTEMQMGGICGSIRFEGMITGMMSLIRAAELVHIGKATSFGLGKIEIV